MDLANPGTPDTWADVVPQHDKDLLQWAAALKVPAKSPFTKLFSFRVSCISCRDPAYILTESGLLVIANA